MQSKAAWAFEHRPDPVGLDHFQIAFFYLRFLLLVGGILMIAGELVADAPLLLRCSLYYLDVFDLYIERSDTGFMRALAPTFTAV